MKIRNILFGALAFAIMSCNQATKEETTTSLASNVESSRHATANKKAPT